MNAQPILHSYYRSSCSWRVRAALAIKGIDYVYKAVNLVSHSNDGQTDGEQHSDSFRKLNPAEQVPAFEVNGHTLIESLAIIEFIDERYDGPPLLPSDPVLRAKSRAIAQLIASGIQPLQNLSVLKKLGEAGPQDLGDKAAWAKYWINLKFFALEKILEDTSGECCVGDQISVADVCLVPQVFNANRFGVDVKQFPLISKINDYLLGLEQFKKSHPSQQPDCPPQFKNTF